MGRLTLAVYALGMGFAVAQTNVPAPAATPPAPAARAESNIATRSDNARYLNDPSLLLDCQTQLDAFSNKPCDIIFIGDSITAGWLKAGNAIWTARYEPLHALDFGVTGDKTQNVLWRLDNMSLGELKPKVAVVLIGANNFDNTPHEIADGVKQVLASTELTFPGIKIILVSLTPNTHADDKMMDADKLLRHLADGSSVYYLDLVPLMPPVSDADGKISNYKGLAPDGLHLDATGYQIWADALDPLLHQLLGK